MAEGRIIGRKDGAIGTLVFDNPGKRNAVSLAMAEQVPEVLGELLTDPAIRVIVVTGSGTASFVSGMDVSEFEARRSNADENAAYQAVAMRMYRAVRDADKPTVAAIRGFCLGGGMAIACACDLRICSDDSQFGIPAARLGLGYAGLYTQWVVEAVGPAYAKEMLLTARRYPAAEARAIGLVHASFPADAFDAGCADYVARIADNAPLTMLAAKRIVDDVASGLDRAKRDRADRLVSDCSTSDDYKEGRRAFTEKRKPTFTGR
ncbi:MAG TPA: enoyl-CoA hydratase [Alphaproteobacteria bacterium]|jgi:enoyl-CoA hydratase|nr:enoyl-CoA hydratase [Alphaproteobacteria bacterium]